MTDLQVVEDPFFAFRPDDIPRWLETDTSELHDRRTIEGVVLFCDISGFTTLTNKMVNRGAEGLEQLSNMINSAFDHWIRAIHDAGGSVAMFIGDALVAVWNPTEGAGADEAIARATESAEVITREAAAAHDVELTCGVGVGQLELAVLRSGMTDVGLVCHGPGLDAAVESCDAHVDQHDVIDLRQRSFAASAGQPETIAIDGKDWAPAGIRDRLTAGQFDWLGELRNVSVVFVGFPDAKDAATLHLHMDSVIDVIGGDGDLLVQPNIDDKGATVLICVGAPVAFDDGPERAIRLARALDERLREEGATFSIGVSSGRAFCGAIGNRSRRTYTIMGDVANIASRLMSQRNGMLVDAATIDATQGRLGLVDEESFTLKGLPRPVVAGRAVQLARSEVGSFELTGRHEERAAIERVCRNAAAETLVITGDAGFGKTALAVHAAEVASENGAVAIIGSATALESDRPYGVWRSAFESTFPEGAVGAAAIALAESDDQRAHLVPLLSVLSDEIEPDSSLDDLTGTIRAQNTRALVASLLRLLLDDRPGVVVLEDAHRFDSASWALIAELQGLVPIGLILTHRPIDIPPRELQRVLSRRMTTRMVLDNMPAADIEELICRRFEVDGLPSVVRSRLVDRGFGNPLFAEQLITGMLEAGHLRIDDRVLSAGDGFADAVSVTPTIEALLTSRIDQSSAGAQLTLKVASVIGHEYELPMLQDVHPLEATAVVSEDSQELAGRQLVRSLMPRSGHSYEFWHALTRDVAYELLPPDQRRSLHRNIATWCERAPTPRPATVKAFHHLRGQNWAQAAEHLEAAGLEAVDAYSNAEVASSFDQLIELFDSGRIVATDTSVARWCRLAGDGWLGLSEYELARERYVRALDLLDAPFPTSAVGQLGVAIRSMPMVMAERMPPASDDPDRASEIASILQLISQAAYFDQDLPAMMYCTTESIRWAERARDARLISRARGTWAIVARLSGLNRSSDSSGILARAAAEEDGRVETRAYAQLLRCIAHFGCGNWEEAEAGLHIARELYAELGATSESDLTYAAWVSVELLQGRPDGAREMINQFSATANRQVQLWGISLGVIADVMDGVESDPEKIDQLVDMGSAPKLEKGDVVISWGAVALASVHDPERLRLAHDRVDDWVRGVPASNVYNGFGLYGLIVTAHLVDGSRGLANRAMRHLRVAGFQNPALAPLAHVTLALRARTGFGRRRHLRRARRRADALGVGYVDAFYEHGRNLIA